MPSVSSHPIVGALAVLATTAVGRYVPAAGLGPEAMVALPFGVALGMALVYGPGRSLWTLAALTVGLMVAGVPPVAAVAAAVIDTVATQIGGWLVAQLARGPRAFERASHVAVFGLATLLAPASLSAAGHAAIQSLLVAPGDTRMDMVALHAWWASLTAAALVTPLFTTWALRPRLSLSRRLGERRHTVRGWQAWVTGRALEGWALLFSTLAAAALSTGPWVPSGARPVAVAIVPFAVLSWAALRFGARETATVLTMLGATILWAWHAGLSPLGADVSMVAMQAWACLLGLVALTVAASVDHRNRLDSELHQMAVTDPLTGLANYRHLSTSIDRQIRRTQHTGQPFALLLLDVDNLKIVNDQLGHNVGSRLLVRVADALRASCRVTDLIARYGGDEFAVLLPGCDEQAARLHAARVQAAFDADAATPRIAASMGVAVHPHDGDSAEQLLDHADAELYAMKGRGRKS